MRSTITSRSPALSVASAVWRAGESPSTKSASSCLGLGSGFLSTAAPSIGAEPIESGRAGDAEQPGTALPRRGVEARPLAQGLLESAPRRDRRRVPGHASDRAGSRRHRPGDARPPLRTSGGLRCCVKGLVSVIACMTVLRRRVAVASHIGRLRAREERRRGVETRPRPPPGIRGGHELSTDDVVHWCDHRSAGIRSELRHDRKQRRPEGLERLLRVPDVEYLDLAVGLHRDVEETCRPGPRLRPLRDSQHVVISRRRERAWREVEARVPLLARPWRTLRVGRLRLPGGATLVSVTLSADRRWRFASTSMKLNS